MRLARYMYVFREHMKYWLGRGHKGAFNLNAEFAADARFLAVWSCIDDRRKLAWPSMVTLVDHYIDMIFGREVYKRKLAEFQSEGVDWIDVNGGILWDLNIVREYNRLVAGAKYRGV